MTMPRPYRWHTCARDHRWHAPVVFARDTVNLSGERRSTCPTCGEVSRSSEPWTLADGAAYPFADLSYPYTPPDEWRR